jgi:hypothetical protein
MPLFAKAGSIIPMQQVMQSTGERPVDTLTLAVYPSGGSASSFTLYEDDGTTLGYERGEYALTVYEQASGPPSDGTSFVVRVGETRGNYAGKPAHRFHIIEVYGIEVGPAEVLVNDTPIPEARTQGDLRNLATGFLYDGNTRRVVVHAPAAADSGFVVKLESLTLAVAEKPPASPTAPSVAPNFPNPFNSSTTIRFSLPSSEPVTLTVYDLLGREVRRLLVGVPLSGEHTVRFDGMGLASGAYIYRLTTPTFSAARIMELLR